MYFCVFGNANDFNELVAQFQTKVNEIHGKKSVALFSYCVALAYFP